MIESDKQFVRINGIAFGEETKGNTVQWIAREFRAHTVWRSGGWQGGHHISHEDGREQAFSFFGAGTFDGARTYLKHMVISPAELFQEALELEEKGVMNALDLITIDENCLTTTPYHSAISRFREIMRGKDRKGTVGKGVGEAIKDSSSDELTIRAKDFFDPNKVQVKVENIRKAKLAQAQTIADSCASLPEEARAELEILKDTSLVALTSEACLYLSRLVPIVDEVFLDDLLHQKGTIVNEVSHGTLHHPKYGFLPHVTQIDPTSRDVAETLKRHNYSGRTIRLGVVRTYLTRHGAGPLVSLSQELTDSLIETHNNKANEWLGNFRTGHFDIVALKYSIGFSGGSDSYNGLVISHMDLLKARPEWQVCEAYEYQGKPTDLSNFFQMEGNRIVGIKICPEDKNLAEHQKELTKLLKYCRPILETLSSTPNNNLEEVFLDYVEAKLEVPVVGIAYGPKASNRHFRRPL